MPYLPLSFDHEQIAKSFIFNEIEGLNTIYLRGRSSAGRASRSQCEGREFDPPRLQANSQF